MCFGEEYCDRQPDAGSDCVSSCSPEQTCSTCNENANGSLCNWSCVFTEACSRSLEDPKCAACPLELPDRNTSANTNLFGSRCDFGETCCEHRQFDAGGDCITSCFPESTCYYITNTNGGASCTWSCVQFAEPVACFLVDPACL
jgi:hypothetical protein